LKKPFISLGRPKDILCLLLSLALSLGALSLFFRDEDSLAVSAMGETKPRLQGLYSLTEKIAD